MSRVKEICVVNQCFQNSRNLEGNMLSGTLPTEYGQLVNVVSWYDYSSSVKEDLYLSNCIFSHFIEVFSEPSIFSSSSPPLSNSLSCRIIRENWLTGSIPQEYNNFTRLTNWYCGFYSSTFLNK